MVNDEPNVQQTKSHSRDDDEVHRRDCVLVIVQESDPALLLTWIGRSLREITRDGCETDAEAELLELGEDLPPTPVVLCGQPTNELLHLLRDRRSPGTPLRNSSPIDTEALAVPANHRVRLDG